jgi:hypothetical protein
MNRKASIATGSLLGACALHLLYVACGSPTNAQAQATACSSWQVATYYQPNVLTRTGSADWPIGLSNAVNLPNGWEPLEAAPFSGSTSNSVSTVGALVVVRHCAQ